MINQMIAELRMIETRTRRQWEDDAAERANNTDYKISQESKDALARGRELAGYIRRKLGLDSVQRQ